MGHAVSRYLLFLDVFIYAHTDALGTPKRTLSVVFLLLNHTCLYQTLDNIIPSIVYLIHLHEAFYAPIFFASIVVHSISHSLLYLDVFIYLSSDDLATPNQPLSFLRLPPIHGGLYRAF